MKIHEGTALKTDIKTIGLLIGAVAIAVWTYLV